MRLHRIDNALLMRCCKQVVDRRMATTQSIRVLISMESIYSKSLAMDICSQVQSLAYLQLALAVFQSVAPADRDTICVNSMLKCYIHHQRYTEAIQLFDACADSGVAHNDVSHIFFLHACKKLNDYRRGKQCIDTHLCGTAIDIRCTTTIVDFYGHFGETRLAGQTFHAVSALQQTIVCVNAMLTCLVNNGLYSEALALFERCRLRKNDVSRTLFLKACMHADAHEKGQEIVQRILVDATALNACGIELINTAIDFCGHFGRTDDALRIFQRIPAHKRDTVSLNTMLKCFVNNHRYQSAMHLFDEFQAIATSLACCDISKLLFLKACKGGNCFQRGQRFMDCHMRDAVVHDSDEEDGVQLPSKYSVQLLNTCMDFYRHFGHFEWAQRIFDAMPVAQRDVVSVNVMLTCFVHSQRPRAAVHLFEHSSEKLRDDISNMLYLKACASLKDFTRGQCLIETSTSQHRSIELVNAVIDFYAESGKVDDALRVFRSIPRATRNSVSLNSMLTCFMKNELPKKASLLFEEYDGEGDDVTMLLFLKICVSLDAFEKGKTALDKFVRQPEEHCVELLNTIIDFYGHFGCVHQALKVLCSIPTLDSVSIGAMMNAYNSNGHWHEALQLFHDTDCDKRDRDALSFSMALDACAALMSTQRARDIIAELQQPRNSVLWRDCNVQSALIRFYAKTNDVETATKVFETMDADVFDADKNGIIVQSVMDCYAKIGDTEKLLQVYRKLKHEGKVTLSSAMHSIVLSGCSHAGLVDEAVAIFAEIQQDEKYQRRDIDPKTLVSMIDCFARTNHIERAIELYNKQQNTMNVASKRHAVLSILSACGTHNELVTAQNIFEENKSQMIDIRIYTQMLNIYGQHKLPDRVREIQNEMKEKGID